MCIYMYVYVKEVYELYFCITGLKIWAEIFIGDVGDGDRGFELKKNLLSTSVACGLGILFCLDISSIWTWVFLEIRWFTGSAAQLILTKPPPPSTVQNSYVGVRKEGS